MNAVNDKTIGDEPGSIEALLPWHAAGTLNARDARRVEEALAQDPALAAQFDAIKDELAEAIHLNESLGAPSGRALNTLMAAIDAEPARKPAMSFSLSARVTEFFASLTPRTLAYASGVAVLALVLQAGVIGNFVMKDRGAGFETASFQNPAIAPGAYALVQFAPNAQASDIMAFLGAYEAWIVEGPKAGMFRVRVGDKALSKAELSALVNKLQGEKVVSFAAPAE